jgi:hypothetical protein
MKGFWVPIAGGVCIPLLLFTLAMLIGDKLEYRWGMPWLANALRFSVVAPMALWERVFPPLPTGPSDKAIVATIVTVFLLYALATYVVQTAAGRLRT